MKKVLLSLLGASTIILGVSDVSASEVKFSDVDQSKWSYESINQVASNGYISGYEDGTFRPTKTITRAEAAVILNNYLTKEGRVVISNNNPFKDVPSNAWYAQAVKNVSGMGIVAGISKDKFSPNASLTRAQMAAFMNRMEGYVVKDNNAFDSDDDYTFTDVSNYAWYDENVRIAYSNGIMNGTGNGKFVPNGKVTREQFAVTLTNVLNYDEDYIAPEIKLPVTNEPYFEHDKAGDVSRRAYYAMLDAGLSPLIDGSMGIGDVEAQDGNTFYLMARSSNRTSIGLCPTRGISNKDYITYGKILYSYTGIGTIEGWADSAKKAYLGRSNRTEEEYIAYGDDNLIVIYNNFKLKYEPGAPHGIYVDIYE